MHEEISLCCWSAAKLPGRMQEEMRGRKVRGFFLMQDRWGIDEGSMRDEIGGRDQRPLTATKSADPRAGTDREDLRRRLHRSQDTADPLHGKQTAWGWSPCPSLKWKWGGVTLFFWWGGNDQFIMVSVVSAYLYCRSLQEQRNKNIHTYRISHISKLAEISAETFAKILNE